MRIGQLIFHQPAEKKQKMKRMEKINKKIASLKSSLVINRTFSFIYTYTCIIYVNTNYRYVNLKKKKNVVKMPQDFDVLSHAHIYFCE